MVTVSKSVLPVTVLAASLALAACGSSSNSATSTAPKSRPASTSSSGASTAAVIKTASNPTLGTVLVNGQGMTLYALGAEAHGKWICKTSGCLQAWHPVTVTAGATPSGIASLGVVKRPDGTEQVTYKGMPLYTFAQDRSPGQASGQGVKDVGTWKAVVVGVKKSSSSSSSGNSGTSSAPASSGGGSYAY